jgi:phage gp36-like protein
MAVGYSDLASMQVAYPAKIVNLLLDDKKDDMLPEEDVFAIVNGNVGIMIRQKLNKRYSDYFTAWETEPHETVELISDRITIYEYYVRKSRMPPGKITREYKEAMQLLQDLADNKQNLTGITLDDDKSDYWSKESGGTMTLDERDKVTGTVTKKGTMHYF